MMMAGKAKDTMRDAAAKDVWDFYHLAGQLERLRVAINAAVAAAPSPNAAVDALSTLRREAEQKCDAMMAGLINRLTAAG